MDNLNEEIDSILEGSLGEYYKASDLKGFARRGLTDKEKTKIRSSMPSINVYKGKSGKSAQSLFDKAGVNKRLKKLILKALEADLQKAGFNPLEEAKRQVVSLDTTIGLLSKVSDPTQLRKVRKALTAFLRTNKIRIDSESSKRLQFDDIPNIEIGEPEYAAQRKAKKDAEKVKMTTGVPAAADKKKQILKKKIKIAQRLDIDPDTLMQFRSEPDAEKEALIFAEPDAAKKKLLRRVLFQEGELAEIVIDLEELKSNKLNESFLAMFGGWVEHILGAMFGKRSLPVSVRGSRRDVESFAKAIGGEKSYLEAAKRYGLDHPTTYKNKAKLDNAIKGFERDTGLKWPFK